jgi:hypothetical protein
MACCFLCFSDKPLAGQPPSTCGKEREYGNSKEGKIIAM